MTAIDLDAYFHRIGHDGGLAPTLDTLRALHLRHPETIPFENLNPLLGWPVRLDPAALEQKLVRDGRGGYCYEHNLLFRHVLESIGFRVAGFAARVLWNAPEGTVRPKTHMLLGVEVGRERYLADVGFGGQTPTAPLRLEPGVEQETPHGRFRLVPAGDGFVLETEVRGAWRGMYRFDLREQHAVDYEVANWFVSTHPGSHFRASLLAARPAPSRRYGLWDNELSVHTAGGTEKRVLTTAAELRSVLTDVFRITLPAVPELDTALARAAAKARPAA